MSRHVTTETIRVIRGSGCCLTCTQDSATFPARSSAADRTPGQNTATNKQNDTATKIQKNGSLRQLRQGFMLKKYQYIMFLCSVISSLLDHSKRFTHFAPPPSWQTCSCHHQLDFFWKHSSHAAIAREY